MWRIGIDEAGRGPVIGPLVVGSILIPEDDLPMLKEAGITDSKLLSHEKRIQLDDWIRKTAMEREWRIELHVSTPAEIDCAMATTNLNDHEISLFASLARKLRPDVGGGILEVDACDTDARRFGNNIASRINGWPWEDWTMDSRHSADLHLLAVGAASIVAKVARDHWIEQLSQEMGVNLGSGYPSDPHTIAAIPSLITGEQPHTCLRWGWATIQRVWEETHGCPPPQRPVDPDGPVSAQRTLF